MSFASSSAARTDVVSNRFAAPGFGPGGVERAASASRDFAGSADVGRVEGRYAAVEGGARASHTASQQMCAANAMPRLAGEAQIHGVTGNNNDGRTSGLSVPALPAR